MSRIGKNGDETIASPVARYKENPQSGLLDQIHRNFPSCFTSSAPNILDEGLTIGVHDAPEGIQPLVADSEVIAHIQKYARLQEGLGGIEGTGERLGLQAIKRIRSGAETKLDYDSLEQREIAVLARGVAG